MRRPSFVASLLWSTLVGSTPVTLTLVGVTLGGCQIDGTLSEPPTPGLQRMMDQPRADSFGATTAFDDGMVMRHPPRGTVPYRAVRDDAPPPLDRALLHEGRVGFDRFCAPCHGGLGDGDSVIAEDMTLRPPPSLLTTRVRARADDDLHTIVTEGYGLMPSYASALTPRERWAVVAYLRALQLSRRADVTALPREVRAELREAAP
ncbi:MAG: cytochrome c [Sandaracinaceae bacterium]